MKRIIITSLAVLALWGGAGVNFAAAQGFGTLGQQPRFNPFVNPSVNNFQGGGFNTYGILRPPFDPNRINDPLNLLQRLNADGSLQGLLANQTNAVQTGLQTGHSVTFLDYGAYFPNGVPTGSTGGIGSTGSLGSAGTIGGLVNTGQGFGTFGSNPAGLIGGGSMGGFQRR